MKKSLTGVIAMLAGAAAGVAATGIRLSERIEEKQKKADKHMSLFLMMNQWVKVKQDGKNLSSYFEKEGYKPVDAVVVTAITFFEEVEEMLRQKVDCPIISLEDILYDV